MDHSWWLQGSDLDAIWGARGVYGYLRSLHCKGFLFCPFSQFPQEEKEQEKQQEKEKEVEVHVGREREREAWLPEIACGDES